MAGLTTARTWSAWSKESAVELDFESELIASLFVDYDAEAIRERLRITNLTASDSKMLNELVAKRRGTTNCGLTNSM